jgi:hypothetical protein
MSRYISLAALWLAAAPAHAGEFSAFEAESISLGSIHGVVYYTVQLDGYRVITMVAEGEDGLPLRFDLIMTGNQKLLISVPGRVGDQSEVLERSRVGDKLLIAQPSQITPKREISVAEP